MSRVFFFFFSSVSSFSSSFSMCCYVSCQFNPTILVLAIRFQWRVVNNIYRTWSRTKHEHPHRRTKRVREENTSLGFLSLSFSLHFFLSHFIFLFISLSSSWETMEESVSWFTHMEKCFCYDELLFDDWRNQFFLQRFLQFWNDFFLVLKIVNKKNMTLVVYSNWNSTHHTKVLATKSKE